MSEDKGDTSISLIDAGKSIAAVIDSVRGGIWTLFEPKAIVRKATAEGQALLIKAEAEVGVESLRRRASQRFEEQRLRYQANLEAITDHASSHAIRLLDEGRMARAQTITSPDPDWTEEWVTNAERIHDPDVQELWGKILAEQIAQPNSFSKRTLALLRLLNKDEALLFQKFCSYCVVDPTERDALPVFLWPPTLLERLGDEALNDMDIEELASIGLILSNDASMKQDSMPRRFHYFTHTVEISDVRDHGRLPIRIFSTVGQELRRVCEIFPIERFETHLVDALKAARTTASIVDPPDPRANRVFRGNRL